MSGFISLSGTFDLTGFLDGFYDENCYFNLPTHYLPRLADPRFLDRLRRSRYVLVTGRDDHCLARNHDLDRILSEKKSPTNSTCGTSRILTTGLAGSK